MPSPESTEPLLHMSQAINETFEFGRYRGSWLLAPGRRGRSLGPRCMGPGELILLSNQKSAKSTSSSPSKSAGRQGSVRGAPGGVKQLANNAKSLRSEGERADQTGRRASQVRRG